ncbi:hypothetical protein evm_010620 [Chilo suppressalis]|nr:hypothetical protein evm_010620 [Chilo suppressalis]
MIPATDADNVNKDVYDNANTASSLPDTKVRDGSRLKTSGRTMRKSTNVTTGKAITENFFILTYTCAENK